MSLIPSWCQELRAARLARDWSEDDLADHIQNWEYRHGAGRTLGVSRSYVSEWETGKRGVSRDYAIRIEGVTGIPRDHFIDHRSSRGRVVRLYEAEVGLRWADDLDDAVEVLIELWRCRLDRREFLVGHGCHRGDQRGRVAMAGQSPREPGATGRRIWVGRAFGPRGGSGDAGQPEGH